MKLPNGKLIALAIILLISALIISGCNIKDQETPDPNVIYTQAAQTVSAQRTSTAVADEPAVDVNAIKTEVAQTLVAELTADAPVVESTATPMPVRPSATPPDLSDDQSQGGDQGAQQPQATSTPVKSTGSEKVDDVAQFTYQYPGDDYEFNPGSMFDAKFTFKNVGPTTWTDSYTLRWYMGDTLGLEDLKYTLAEAGSLTTVKPGESVTFTIKGMTAPSGAGTYQSNWRLCNADVKCFYLVYIQIIVN